MQSRVASLLLVSLGLWGCADSVKDAPLEAEAVTLAPDNTGVHADCTSSAASSTPTNSTAQSPEPGPGNTTPEGGGATQPDPSPGMDFPVDPACAGRSNGALCGDYAVCIDQRCMPSVCGDGIVLKGLEECEDGNRERNDGCYACLFERCGDGLIHPGEACDDGNNIRNDKCDHQCKRTPQNLCGNGEVDENEECDDGNEVHDDACRNDCRVHAPALCGNGKVDPGETCDDGNLRENDGCGPSCQIERCGDGFIWAAYEQCDDGNLIDGDGCSAKCRVESPVCGNAVVDPGEDCDDGNNRNGDDCPNDCLNPQCGDRIIEGRESCDDGNLVSGDGCSAECVKETQCGNGIVEFLVGGEHCDDGNDNNFDRCPNNCKVPVCGDGQRSGAFEECDGEDSPGGKNCDETCHFKPLCGNGVVERSVEHLALSEVCDDGNTENGDACASDCRGIDESKCGDGIVQAELGEQCDLGPLPDRFPDKAAKAEFIRKRNLTCNKCQWSFFDQACSECVGERGNGNIESACPSNEAGPCLDVLACYTEQRCMDNKLGALPCVCGDLGVNACMKAESFPGACHAVALARSFDSLDPKRVLMKETGSFISRFSNPQHPYGRASQTGLLLGRFCAQACSDYLSPNLK